MTGDQRALLAAIVANPADDTVRLAYADCIEEQGNSARAEFIRVQIEAERLHPDSNARARLEARAEALFAEHWLEWWGEVCAATGLFYPRRGPKSRLGRAMWRLANFGAEIDNPYTRSGFTIDWGKRIRLNETSIPAWARFHRGFPDSVTASGMLPAELSSWSDTSPLMALTIHRADRRQWTNDVSEIRRLTLQNCSTRVLQDLLRSDGLTHLEELHYERFESSYPPFALERHALALFELLADWPDLPLRSLTVPAVSNQVLELLDRTPQLMALEALRVQLIARFYTVDEATPTEEVLAQSPNLRNLRELEVYTHLRTGDCRHLTRRPVWQGLRKLTIANAMSFAPLQSLLQDANLPALEELRMHCIGLDREVIDLLIASPLLKQLKHFAIGASGVGEIADADLRRLPEMFDLDKLETFRLDPDHDRPGLDVLQERLGDRLRLG